MKLTISPVDANYVHVIWPQVKSYIEKGLKLGQPYEAAFHAYNADNVLQFVAAGQWLLLVAVDAGKIYGAGALAFTNFPLYRAATITVMGGKFLVNPDMYEQLKKIAKSRGATVLQAYCRDSMVRLAQRVGFEPHTRLVEQLL